MSKKIFKIKNCKNFTGYKPCFPFSECHQKGRCEKPNPIGKRILIINLDAMGAVVQTTSMLKAIKRKFPQSTISWITLKNAVRLLDNNPFLDNVYEWNAESWLVLQNLKWDLVYSADKTKLACSFAKTLKSKKNLGFGINENGVIKPLNKEAKYLFKLGLDDNLKFKLNKKVGTEILQEAMQLNFKRDEYILNLSSEEEEFCAKYKKENNISEKDLVVGFNTGCSNLFQNKKMTIAQHVSIIKKLLNEKNIKIVLLGGREDTERNLEISKIIGNKIINTPTTEGVRNGICYENICDVVVSGDSFGMHVAIGLKKFVIAWFGLSCWSEIDLYDRGVKLIPEGLQCAPCWKKNCPYDLECIQMIDLEKIVTEILNYKKRK